MAATPMIKIPVPKKNEEAIEIPKYLRKITFKNVYRLAQPRLMIILLTIAIIKAPTFAEKDMPTKRPDATVPSRYVRHIQAMANAQVMVFDII